MLFTLCTCKKESIPVGNPENNSSIDSSDYPNWIHYQARFAENKHIKLYVTDAAYQNNTVGTPVYGLKEAFDILALFIKYDTIQNRSYSIILSEGEYRPNSTLVINQHCSKTPGKPIIIQGDSGKTIRISGCITINNTAIKHLSGKNKAWQTVPKKKNNKVLVIDLKDVGIKNICNFEMIGYGYTPKPSLPELFIDGQPMTLARWPNATYANIDSVFNSTHFQCNSPQIKKWANEQHAMAMGFWQHGWMDCHVPIKKVDTLQNNIILKEKPFLNQQITPGNQWFAYNVLAELDTPGEFYLDIKNKMIYFMPPASFNIKTSTVTVSNFGGDNKPLLQFDSASNITIKNIHFTETRAGAIMVSNSNNIRFENCTISNTGTYGLLLSGTNCTISNTEIANTAAFGIKLAGGNRATLSKSNNVIENCKIHHTGRTTLTVQCPVHLEGVGHTVKNCEIFEAPSIGIIFSGNYHTIEKNNIYNVCRKVDDNGAIYCGRDWAMHGNLIRYNYIHDINRDAYVKHKKSINGIYLDDCASGITVYGNIISNIRSYGIFSSGGRNNIFENNIITGCKYAFTTNTGGRQISLQKKLYQSLNKIDYQNPPWSTHFPELAKMSAKKTKRHERWHVEALATKFPGLCAAFNIQYHCDFVPQACVFSNNIGWDNKKWMVDTRLGKGNKPGAFTYFTIGENYPGLNPMLITHNHALAGFDDNSPLYQNPGFNSIPFTEIGLKKE